MDRTGNQLFLTLALVVLLTLVLVAALRLDGPAVRNGLTAGQSTPVGTAAAVQCPFTLRRALDAVSASSMPSSTLTTPTSSSALVQAVNRQVAGASGLLAIRWPRLTAGERAAALDEVISSLDEADRRLAAQLGEPWADQQRAAIQDLRTGLFRFKNGDPGGLAQFMVGAAANAQL